ncbi:MAG: 2-hydroxyglutaryl-CoA dehydratase [Clostridia bacterium]|nr:2-hydroxyglutaryl-CoA dehydratase [Clostridia bacterium]
MITLGIDIGSTTSKAVLMENGQKVLAKNIVPLGTGTSGAQTVFDNVLKMAGITPEEIDYALSTGYGRYSFEFAKRQISEVSCHAKGIRFLVPTARTIIDIGGQDAKALSLAPNGALMNFVMNDKCAAGTGRFLDVMARVLDVKVEDMGDISELSQKEITINNTCTVFAESEVISRLSSKEKIEDIIAGIHASVAKRVSGQALRVGVTDDVVMSGGVARNRGIVRAMEKEIGHKIAVPEDCQLAGALGAALFAWDELLKEKKAEENR